MNLVELVIALDDFLGKEIETLENGLKFETVSFENHILKFGNGICYDLQKGEYVSK